MAGYGENDSLVEYGGYGENDTPVDGDLTGSPSKSSGVMRRAADFGLTAIKGAIGVPETVVGLADLVTGGYAGKALEQLGFRPEEAKAFLDEHYSDSQKAANKTLDDATGFLGKAAAAVQNPSTIAHTIVESLPVMGAGGLIGQSLVKGSAKVAPWAAGAIGEGVVGGGLAAEQIRQQTDDGLLTPTQMGAAGASALGTAAFGAAGGKLAQKMGIADVDTMLAGGAAKLSNKGFARRLVEGGISEGAFEEMPQSMQEQLWQNVAMNKPLLEGVPEAGGIGLVTGGVMGGAASGFFGGKQKEVAQTPPPTPEDHAKTILEQPDLQSALDAAFNANTASFTDRGLLALPPASDTTGPTMTVDAAGNVSPAVADTITTPTPKIGGKPVNEITDAWLAKFARMDSPAASVAREELKRRQEVSNGPIGTETAKIPAIPADNGIGTETPIGMPNQTSYAESSVIGTTVPVGIPDAGGNVVPDVKVQHVPSTNSATQPTQQNANTRTATLEERVVSEKARPVLDLSKQQTGWKRIDGRNNDSVTLVSFDGKHAVDFKSSDTKSGSASVRMNAEAHDFAIDNPYSGAPTPQGELIAKPIYSNPATTATETAISPTPMSETSANPLNSLTPLVAKLSQQKAQNPDLKIHFETAKKILAGEVTPRPLHAKQFANLAKKYRAAAEASSRIAGRDNANAVADNLQGIADALKSVLGAIPKKARSFNGELLHDIRALGGIIDSERNDTTGESKAGNVKKQNGVFTPNGRGVDEILTELTQNGDYSQYLDDVDGGIAKLKEDIRAALSGEMIYSPREQERILDAQKEKEYRDSIRDYAVENGIRVTGVEFSKIADEVFRLKEMKQAEQEAELEHEESIAYDGLLAELTKTLGEETTEEVLETLATKYANASPLEYFKEAKRTFQEIIDGVNRKQPQGIQRPEQATAAEADGTGREPAGAGRTETQGQDDFSLEGQTEAEIAADAERLAKQETEKKRKESAPPPEEFTLTGSNRAADEGAARGQQDLTEPSTQPANVSTISDNGDTSPANPQAEAITKMADIVSKLADKVDAIGKKQDTVADTGKPMETAQEGNGGEAAPIEDFGQKIEGSRKDLAAAISKELGDDEIAALPLSKIWPSDLSDKIEDKFVAALAFAARAEIPSKPRKSYAVSRWVEKVKTLRGMVNTVLSSDAMRAKAEALLNESAALKDFTAKVSLLNEIDRSQWGRIGSVGEYPNAYRYEGVGEDVKKVPTPMVKVVIDNATQYFNGISSVADAIDQINEKLGVEAKAKKMAFEVRGTDSKGYGINKKGDSEYRRLKTFKTAKEALDYRNSNYDDLVSAWEDVKNRDNVKKDDVRGESNRPRTAEDYRKGKDISTEKFQKEFGFRGGQFGKWVSQGSNAKERQWMLNNAYDALMDLSSILGIPPKAISLNGELNMAFGARGSGAASAHYESDTLVINLTKTRGAGTLAHEWFHALDNYFQRSRGALMDNKRENRYITYAPEAYYEKADGTKMAVKDFEAATAHEPIQVQHGQDAPTRKIAMDQRSIENKAWWKKYDAVRPEVEAKFAELVQALNESPMTARASIIDKGKADGYWSRIIERAARSFENYVIAKMAENGYHNDYLANVVNIAEFKRDAGRYPYLKDEELAPVVEAFDNLFGEMQTKETDQGTKLYSQSAQSQGDSGLGNVTIKPIQTIIKPIARILEAENAVQVSVTGGNSDVLRQIAKKFGKKIIFMSEVDDMGLQGSGLGLQYQGTKPVTGYGKGGDRASGMEGESENDGFVDSEYPGLIFLNVRGSNHLGFTIGHELGHSMMIDDPVLWASMAQQLKPFAMDFSTYKQSQGHSEKTDSEATMEFVSDVIGSNFLNPQFWDEMAQQHETIFKKIARKFIEVLNKAMRVMGVDVSPYLSDLKQSRAIIAKAMMQYSDNASKGMYGVYAKQINPGYGGRKYSKASTAGNSGKWESPEPSMLDNFVYRVQNKHIDLKQVQQAIKETSGQIKDDINAYLKEELFHGRAATRIDEFLNDELNPLISMMRMSKVSQEELGKYLWAKHAKEANAHIASINPDNEEMQDGGSGMTDQEADDYMTALTPEQRKTFETLAKRVYAMTAKTRQQQLEYGLISQADKDTWESAYQFYVPLNREGMDTMAHGTGTGQGYSIRGGESKKRTGSKREVVDILGNIANQRDKAVVRGEKNRVVMALYGLAQENPNPDFWKVDKPPVMRVVEKTKLINKVVDESTGVELDRFDTLKEAEKYSISHPGTAVEQLLTDQVVERIDPLYKSKDNVVMVKIPNPDTGAIEEHSIIFNERNERAVRMAASIKNLDGSQLGELLGTTAKVTRYFSAINTQYNPIFGVVNLVRDVQGAMINLTDTPLAGKQGKILADVWKILAGSIKHKMRGFDGEWAKLAEEFAEAGGKTGYRDMFRTGADRSEAIEKALDPDWWTKTAWGKVITAKGHLENPAALLIDKGARPLRDWLSDYNDTMENTVRLAAYKEAKASGMSIEQAASLAKNLTVNFNRKGEIALQAGSLYAFFNASTQGMTRMLSALKGPAGKKIIYGGITIGAMQALLLAAAGFDDEEPPDFVRERNLILPIGDKKYLTLPMPLGFNVLPNIGRLSMELMLSGGKGASKKIESMMGVLVDATNPLGGSAPIAQIISPTITDPIVALGMNKDWTGKPIAREDFNSLNPTPGYTRSKDVSSAPAKWIAEAINTLSGGTKYKQGIASPTADQIEYLIGQVTGGVGREIGKVATTTETMFTGEDLPSHKIPLVGRFYGSTEGQAAEGNAFYANLKEMNSHEATIKGLRKDHKGAEAMKYLRENPEARLFGFANQVERRVGELRKQKRQLIENNASKERIKLIEMRITGEMKKLNDRLDRLKHPEKNAA